MGCGRSSKYMKMAQKKIVESRLIAEVHFLRKKVTWSESTRPCMKKMS